MKNKVVIAILVIVMILPSIVAIINYNSEQRGEVSNINVLSMSLVDPAGNIYNFTREGDEDQLKMIEYFVSTKNDAEEIASIPSTIESGNYYRLSVNTSASETAYKYYFTSNTQDCYFVDGDGKTYQMSEKKAHQFLTSGYAAHLYENGTAPMLSVTGQNLMPDACTWNFINSDGKYTAAVTPVSESVEAVEIEGGFAMDFTNQPDSFTVKLTDKGTGEVVFDDVYDNISSVIVTKNMALKAEVTAKWYEDKTRNYYGEQTFIFDASLSAPAEFYAGINTIQVGEFVCITAVNVNKPENIQFTSEPDIGYAPKFFTQEDGLSYALVPFKSDLEVGQYTLSFSYGGASQNINIDLQNRDNAFRTREKTYADAVVENYYKDEVIAKTEETLRPIAQSSVEKMYFEGVFPEVCDTEVATLSTGYGHTIQVKGTEISYFHSGVDYAGPMGTAVNAGNAGEVVFADYLDHTGYIVVIDHGLGLKSWYAHLGKVAVKVGDVVATGDQIGEFGSTGFANETGVHVGYTIFETPVCQYTLWADGNNKGVPVYKPE
ncbi:MAG: M23 family metallopeptidase [Clostridia bacterium]|nr:M23 family metallopeptidase [Clostridia bacterium]